MAAPEEANSAELTERVRDVLAEYPVSLAILFGSGGRGALTSTSDIDIAVAFTEAGSGDDGDDGDTERFLHLYNAVDDAFDRDVDVVEFHSMSPRVARAVFDNGVVLVGSAEHRREVEKELAGEFDSVEEAKRRVSEAVERMKAGRNR